MEEERGKERERDSLEKTISSDEEKYSFALIIPLCDKRIVHRAANHQSFLLYTSGCSSRSPLATLDSRLLKYSRIRVARRNFPSIHLSVPFSSLWASFFFERYFSNIDTLYPFFQEQRPLEGDHHRMDSQREASSSEDRPFIQASICIYVEATRAAQDERLFSIPGRPPADLFHTSSPCSFRNRDESSSFCKNRGIDGNFFFDFSWQLTVVTDMAGVAQLPRN